MRILVVCSANQCRSPMGAALLRARLVGRACDATVGSAGFGPPGQPATPETVEVMGDIGIDLTDHRSRRVTAELCAGADLVIGMTRQHVVDLAVLEPAAWPRAFPLIDLVRRGAQMGARPRHEDPVTWVQRAHGGRQPSSVLSLAASDDVDDPIGQGIEAFRSTRRLLDGLVSELAALLAAPDEATGDPTGGDTGSDRPIEWPRWET